MVHVAKVDPPRMGDASGWSRYWSTQAGVTLSLAKWRGAVTVSNLFDRRGNSFGFGNPFSFRLQNQRTPIRPRTVAIRLEKDF